MTPKAVYAGSRSTPDLRGKLREIGAAKVVEVYAMDLASDSYRMIPRPVPFLS
jgi:hypothetical protein